MRCRPPAGPPTTGPPPGPAARRPPLQAAVLCDRIATLRPHRYGRPNARAAAHALRNVCGAAIAAKTSGHTAAGARLRRRADGAILLKRGETGGGPAPRRAAQTRAHTRFSRVSLLRRAAPPWPRALGCAASIPSVPSATRARLARRRPVPRRTRVFPRPPVGKVLVVLFM